MLTERVLHLAAAVAIALAVSGVVALLMDNVRTPYVYLACTDTFTGHSFQTDMTVLEVVPTATGYRLYRDTGDMTVVITDASDVCSLSRTYPVHVRSGGLHAPTD